MPNEEGSRCPVCGETAPEPAWLCLNRLGGTAVKGESCAYSVEAEERAGIALRALMNEVEAEHVARASGIPVQGGEDV